jgi:hypothetical protein
MRALHVIKESEGFSHEALDDYGKPFGQPLPNSHVQALAALFGWATPEDVNGESWCVPGLYMVELLYFSINESFKYLVLEHART